MQALAEHPVLYALRLGVGAFPASKSSVAANSVSIVSIAVTTACAAMAASTYHQLRGR